MLFPGSRIWFEGAAADLAGITEEIRSSGLSGHVVLEFQDSVDVVICVGGEFQKVIEKIGRRLLSTKKYREIWGKCQIKPGRMTIFELPPPLAHRLRGLEGRTLLVSGAATAGFDTAHFLRERKAERFTGVLDCVSPAGKMLLDFEGGEIVGCWYTEFAGPSREGLEAFRAWHLDFLKQSHPSYFFRSALGAQGGGEQWDELLMDFAEQVPLPLASSVERLARSLGGEAAPGERLPAAGEAPGRLAYLIAGEAELVGPAAGVRIGPGSLLGVGGLVGLAPAGAEARARTPCRFLAFGREDLPLVFRNSPALAARCVREAARLALALRRRLEAFRAEPRLRDFQSAVTAALLASPERAAAGMGAAALVRELTEVLPLTLPEIDDYLRRLAALGLIRQAEGQIALAPPEL